MGNFAAAYATFRGSKTFLIGLLAIVACWLTSHFLTGFDDGFGLLNTFLSIEASISLAFFTMMGDAQSREQAKQTAELERAVNEILRIGAACLDVAQTQRDILREHSDELDTLVAALKQFGGANARHNAG